MEDLTVVDNWIDSIKDLFDRLNYLENRKVSFAMLMLEGEVIVWWHTQKLLYFGELPTIVM